MIGIISDIHGNYPALKAVVNELKKKGCDSIISLGDIAGYYCMINECINLCKEEKILNILGNHDKYLVYDLECPRSQSANICLKYQKKIITKENMDWLSKSVTFFDTDVFSFRHGSWNDPTDGYIYDFNFDLVKNRKELIFASGHTHRQILKKEGFRCYFNPGSVGQPRDYNSESGYAIIDDNNNPELYRIEYPIDEIVHEMRKCGFDDKISKCLYSGTKIGEIA